MRKPWRSWLQRSQALFGLVVLAPLFAGCAAEAQETASQAEQDEQETPSSTSRTSTGTPTALAVQEERGEPCGSSVGLPTFDSETVSAPSHGVTTVTGVRWVDLPCPTLDPIRKEPDPLRPDGK